VNGGELGEPNQLVEQTELPDEIIEQFEHPFDAKLKAEQAVHIAVLTGKLPRLSTVRCKGCGWMAKKYKHKSYAKEDWLNVIPLCNNCFEKGEI